MLDHIEAPPIDLNAIHERAVELRQLAPKTRSRRRAFLIGLLFLVPAVAVGLDIRQVVEQAIMTRLHSEGYKNIAFEKAEPQKITLVQAQSISPYQIVLPTGYPSGYTLYNLSKIGDKPGTFSATYARGKDYFTANLYPVVKGTYYGVAVTQFETDERGHILHEIHPKMRAWIVGNEVMVVTYQHLTDEQLDAMKTALHAKDAPKPPKDAITY